MDTLQEEKGILMEQVAPSAYALAGSRTRCFSSCAGRAAGAADAAGSGPARERSEANARATAGSPSLTPSTTSVMHTRRNTARSARTRTRLKSTHLFLLSSQHSLLPPLISATPFKAADAVSVGGAQARTQRGRG